ncbi:MAG TPA: MBL fold metallo-hydrolase [Candidatus Aenigmarchaeota archaeon]|nr:MBL fold metallo-hydrolase [Candidatus Aenigmarchaeota archaeon]
MLQLTFNGAINEVGRSAILVDTGIERILLDYGSNINEVPPLHPREIVGNIDALFLSHAHLDHSGSIPLLFRKGMEFPVYGLGITKRLTKLLLEDTIKIAKREGYHPGFEKRDVRKTMRNFVSIRYREPIKLKETKVTLIHAGHIPGSSMILIETKDKNILYTGDFNDRDTMLLEKYDLKKLPNIDILITESTYANREHPDRKKVEHEFVKLVNETCSNDGISLVTGFAVGRLQELLLVLDEYNVDWPIYMDGMGIKALRIICDYPQLLREYERLRKLSKKINFVKRGSMRKKIIKRPCVILTTSGMLSGGPVVEYIKRLHDRRDSTLFLTGFQVKNTPGRILLQTGRYINPNEALDLKVKMMVKYLDFSAHVGRSGLFKTIEKLNPSKIFCIHGDDTFGFAKELCEMGYNAIAPAFMGESFTI